MRSLARSSRSGRGRIILASLALLLAACGGATASTAPPAVSDAWIRPPAGMDQPAAGYLVITNASAQADALLRVTSPAATSVELHETTTDSSGMTGMHPVERLEVAAGATVKLEPGGYHLMLMGLGDAVKVGDSIELDLVFEHAGTVAVQAQVRAG